MLCWAQQAEQAKSSVYYMVVGFRHKHIIILLYASGFRLLHLWVYHRADVSSTDLRFTWLLIVMFSFAHTGKDCGTYTPGTGVSCSGLSNRYPSQKSCTCISGYERSGNDNSYSVSCQTNARWSSPDDSRYNYCFSECCATVLSYPVLQLHLHFITFLNITSGFSHWYYVIKGLVVFGCC